MSSPTKNYNGTLGDPISVGMKVYSELEVPISTEPEITNEYKRGEFIETWNKTYFMTDLSNVETILYKNEPEFYGLTFFGALNNIPTIELEFTGQTGNTPAGISINDTNLITFIDGGTNYTHDGVRSEYNVYYGWQPRSNTELFPYVWRSDVDAYDYPSFSVRGMRKIPATTADTLCGAENDSADRRSYNWFFGENAGIDFTTLLSGGTPIATSGSVNTLEGVSTMSTKEGDLLFYSDGLNVYTSGNTLMQNGDGLLGSSSSTQTCLIVPRPSTNKYFVFTTSIDNGLKYSVVDMDLQSGEGQVVSKNNTLLLATEKVAATKHSGGTDYWVMSHTTGTTNYVSRRISSTGIGSAVNTFIGSTHNTAIGYMKFSPDSTKLATAIYDEDIIDIFDFNNGNGTLSNFLTITGFTYINGPYGLEFSTDSSKLYVSDGASTKVYQFDLTYTAATDMVDNAIEVGDVNGGSLGALQMAPDGRIYVADLDEPYLHVIHDPNKLGVECSFQENNFVLSGVSSGNTSQWGLPNVVSNTNFSCDRYVYLQPRSRTEDYHFDVVFDNLSNVIQEKELSFQAKLFKYDYNNKIFSEESTYITPILTNEELNNNTFTINIPYSGIAQGEYMLKGLFNAKFNTLLSKQLGYTKTQIADTYNNVYGQYNPKTDWYLLNLYEADKPILKATGTNPTDNSVVTGFNVRSIFTTSGITNYSFNIGSSDSIGFVSFNGSVLAKDIEYTATTSSVNLGVEVLDNQILTVGYASIANSSGNFYIDTLVVSTYNSGATDTQTNDDKLFYNTDQNKFEYYLDSEPKSPDIGFIVNGSVLASGVEYYRSTTNPRRIILEININSGDIIQSNYLPKTGLVGVVNTNTPVLSWAINTLPVQPVTGDFTIEFADVEDESFDTILYSKNVGYKYDLTAYVESITLSGASAGDQFRYRIKNEKRYQPISGETITDIVYSDVNKMELGTNSGNSY